MSGVKDHARNFALENPEGLYDPSANAYSHVAVVPGDARLVFIAGQVGDTPKGDFGTQVRQTFANLRTAIEAAGGGMGDIAKLTVLIVDHDRDKHRGLISEIERTFGAGLKPTCTIIPVPPMAYENQLVEIEAVGVLDGQGPSRGNSESLGRRSAP